MPKVNCKLCNELFYAKPSWLLRGHGKYCSSRCMHQGQRNGKTVSCYICKRKIYKMPSDLEGSKSGKFFCSKSCQTIWRNSIVYVGEMHPNWTGGESTYRNVMLKNQIPQICKLCDSSDERVLIVHHIDRNRQNNNLTNLLWLCHNCHHLVHHYNEEEKRIMVPIA